MNRISKHARRSPIKIIPISEPPSAQVRALDLLDQALNATTPTEARKLAREAVNLDPDCVDALIVLAKAMRLSNEAYIQKIRAAVQTGERVLGKDFFEENRGHFWLIHETRPYMRALSELATALAT